MEELIEATNEAKLPAKTAARQVCVQHGSSNESAENAQCSDTNTAPFLSPRMNPESP